MLESDDKTLDENEIGRESNENKDDVFGTTLSWSSGTKPFPFYQMNRSNIQLNLVVYLRI